MATEHRWRGRPQDAERWREERRRHAPVYIAVGGGTIVVTAAVAWARWDALEPWGRTMLAAIGGLFGGTIFAFGPLMYWMANNHIIWLELPMRRGWAGDAIVLGTALEGYLASQGVRFSSRRAITPEHHILEVEGGLRVSLVVSGLTGRSDEPKYFILSIHRVNPDNVAEAEALQRTLDGWPLLEGLMGGVDLEMYEAIADMEF